MRSPAAQIRDNNFRVYLYMFLLTVMVGVIGSLISYYFDWGLTGTGAFLLVAGVLDFLAFFFSDKIVLRIAKAKPLSREQAPELYEIVENLARVAQVPPPKLYLLDDTTMNAFATGRDHSHSAIAVTRGLLQKMSREEVEGVVAHEMSHVRYYDMRLMAVASVLAGAISILADLYWASNVASAAGERDRSGAVAMVGMALAVFAPLSAFLVQMAISRKREFVADAGAAELTGKPRALAAALRKISMDVRLPKHVSASTAHLYFSSPSRTSLIERLFSTHPPIEERIAALESIRSN